MGFSYRRSVKVGPFRMTASKSGISYSAGVRGARITKRANGRVQTTLSVPGTGMRYTTTSGTKSRKPARPAASRQAPSRQAPRRGATAVPRSAPIPRPASTAKPKPAARPRPQRRLPSRIPPRIPLASRLPATINGYLARVTLYQGGIQVDRAPALMINGNRSAAISWAEVISIDLLKPTLFRNGHIHFVTLADLRDPSATGHGKRISSPRNPHTIMFTWQQRKAFRRLYDLLAGDPFNVALRPHRRVHRQCARAMPAITGRHGAVHARKTAFSGGRLHSPGAGVRR
jgi:hypothetical protein